MHEQRPGRHRQREKLALTPEQARVLERYHAMFRRAGAALEDDSHLGPPDDTVDPVASHEAAANPPG